MAVGDGEGPTPIRRLVGIYDADGGLTGELRYLVARFRGRGHCSLCDITHGSLREKSAFRQCRARLGVPMELLHRNQRNDVADGFEFNLPCVLAETDGELLCLLDATALESCQGDVDAFERSLREAASARGLVLA